MRVKPFCAILVLLVLIVSSAAVAMTEDYAFSEVFSVPGEAGYICRYDGTNNTTAVFYENIFLVVKLVSVKSQGMTDEEYAQLLKDNGPETSLRSMLGDMDAPVTGKDGYVFGYTHSDQKALEIGMTLCGNDLLLCYGDCSAEAMLRFLESIVVTPAQVRGDE